MKNQKKIEELLKLLNDARNESLYFELLELFFTPNELKQLSARYDIIRSLVLEQETQREIAARLKLSIAKITRGSNELKRCSSQLRSYLLNIFQKNE